MPTVDISEQAQQVEWFSEVSIYSNRKLCLKTSRHKANEVTGGQYSHILYYIKYMKHTNVYW